MKTKLSRIINLSIIIMHPSILIVNDDSIFSGGIKALWEAMSELGKTTVVAPKFDNSGVGHAITISRPLQFEKINLKWTIRVCD